MSTYSETFKTQMVQKLTSPGGPSALALSRQTGVSQTTLSRWVRQSSRVKTMSPRKKTSKRAQKFSAEEKLALILEAAQLDKEEALGRFLRERGLHRSTLDRWRKQILQGLATPSRTSPEARRVRELERELLRKEKALAEASALLVMKKKAALIWGEEDDDTPVRSGK